MGAVIAAEACWFALLHPRTASFGAILLLALLPLTVVGYVYLMAAVSAYLADRRWDFHLRQMIVVMLGLSVGCFVFSLLWLAKVHFETELR
jgi:cell division protein FtsW (lipid II flippase)